MKMTWGNVTFTISNREKRHFPEYGIFLEFTTSVFRWALGQAAPASCMSSAKGIWTRSKQNGLLQNFSSMLEPRRKLFAGLWEVPAVCTGSIHKDKMESWDSSAQRREGSRETSEHIPVPKGGL